MNDLIEDLSRVPELVVPIGAGGIIGHVLLLLIGLAALALGSFAAVRSGSLFVAALLVAPGMHATVVAQHRFLRAVHPDDTGTNIALWIVFLGLAVAGGMLLWRFLDDLPVAVAFGVVAVLAALTARLFDGIHERMHGVPLTWGLVLVGVLIAAGLMADRRA